LSDVSRSDEKLCLQPDFFETVVAYQFLVQDFDAHLAHGTDPTEDVTNKVTAPYLFATQEGDS